MNTRAFVVHVTLAPGDEPGDDRLVQLLKRAAVLELREAGLRDFVVAVRPWRSREEQERERN